MSDKQFLPLLKGPKNFKELKEKHKLGVINGTHPPLYHVHVDRSYSDDWLLFYFIRTFNFVGTM